MTPVTAAIGAELVVVIFIFVVAAIISNLGSTAELVAGWF